MNRSFNSTPHRATKSSGNTAGKVIGSNGNKGKAAASTPAPLTSRCASCGKNRR